jgi:hypothetical protein
VLAQPFGERAHQLDTGAYLIMTVLLPLGIWTASWGAVADTEIDLSAGVYCNPAAAFLIIRPTRIHRGLRVVRAQVKSSPSALAQPLTDITARTPSSALAALDAPRLGRAPWRGV